MSDQTFGSFARDLKKDLTGYINARVEYTKLLAYEKVARLTASATTIVLVSVFCLFTFLFLSVTCAIILGKALNNDALGFGIVTAFDLLVTLLIIWKRDAIENMIIQKVVQSIMDSEEDSKKDKLNDTNSNEATGQTSA